VVDQFWGGREEEAHRGGLSAVEGISGGEKTPASWSRGHRLVRAVGEEILDDVVLGVWSTQPKRGWSGLSMAARVEWGGAVVRGQRGCRG
jgi:hypothetical protein